MFAKSTEFSSLFENPERVIFCGYKNSGLLCLDLDDQSRLVFVSTVASNEKNSTIWFGKVATISLCPPPPTLCEFTQMLLNKNRRKLALISQKLIVIVDMCEDFWINQTLQDAGSVPEFRQEYFAKCNILHMSFFVEKYPPTILKATWYLKESYFSISNKTEFKSSEPISKYIFGVLYSDNAIRIYDVNKNIERALISIDFTELLYTEQIHSLNESESETHSKIFTSESCIGLSNQLISFDFGPLLSLTENVGNDIKSKNLATVMTMDSDGNLYFAAFDFLNQKFFNPCGPLNFLSENELILQKFMCAASDLLFVQHKYNNLPVFAIASSEGVIVHFLLIQREAPEILVKERRNIFELHVYDILDIPNVYKNNSRFTLQNDFSNHSSYIALNQNNVYVVDISSWLYSIHSFLSIMDSDSSDNTTPNYVMDKKSNILHVFMFIDANALKKNVFDNKENISSRVSTIKNKSTKSVSNFIRSLACANVHRFVNDSNIEENEIEQQMDEQILIAITSSGQTMTSCIRHRICIFNEDFLDASKTFDKKLQASDFLFGDKIRYLLNDKEIPTIKFDGLSKKEELNFCLSVIEKLIKNIKKISNTLNYTIDEAQSLLIKYDTINGNNDYNNKLEKVFEQISLNKARMYSYKNSFKAIDERIQKIAQFLQGLTTENDKKIYDQYKKFEEKIKLYKNELNDINMKVLAHRSKFIGNTAPFQASAQAQKFMLTKNDKEINQLKVCLQRLTNDAEKLFINFNEK